MTFAPWRTLRGRLLLLALLVEAVMLALLISNSLRLLRDNMGEQAKLQAEQIAPVINAALVAPLAQFDYATVQAVLDESKAARGIDYLAVLDVRGHVVAISGWAADKPLPDADRGFVLDESEPRYDVARPVMLAAQQLGTLHFGLNLKQIIEARDSLLMQALLIALGELLLSAGLLTLLGLLITRQLSVLTHASIEVAEGKLGLPAVPEGEDDVGRLGAAFNTMSRAVSERVSQLTQARDEMAGLAETNQQERARITALLAAMKFGVLFSDRADRLVYANRAFGTLWGLDADAVVNGATLQSLFARILPLTHYTDTDAWWREVVPGTLAEAELPLRDGRILMLQRLPVTNLNREILGQLWLFSDVSRERLAARQLIAARDAADAANRAKSDFLANMSHEIRTPMNGIIGMIELVLESELKPEQSEFLGIARSSSDALLAIINEILDFSKIEAGKFEIENIAFDPATVLTETLKPLRLSADQKGLQLREDIAVPPRVSGDPARLRQILVNLVSNAIKFTEHGQVTVKASVAAAATGQLLLQLAVADTGIGIPPEKQRYIFDAFAQEDASTTRRYGGTGLGLTICNRLVALMGGTIGVQSEPGKGSTFHVSLPLGAVNRQAPPVEPAAAAAQPATAGTSNLNILVAEDNSVNQKLIFTLLKKLGHQVTLADNGQQAVELWAPGRYDLILMDLQMPLLGGLEATRLIRAAERELRAAHVTPICALTAAAMVDEQQQGLAAGLDGYLTKPINRAALLELLERVAAGRSSAFDYAAALQAADAEIIAIIGQDFLDQIPALSAALRQTADLDQRVELERLTHTAKGLAANFGAAPLIAAATALEQACSRGESPGAAVDALTRELQAFGLALSEFLALKET